MLTAIVSGCGRPDGTSLATREADADRVREVAMKPVLRLKKELKQALGEAMKASGPVGAIEACALQAPALTAAASADGIRIGRSAIKLRNPRNAAPDWAAPLLAELAETSREDGTFKTTTLPDGRRGYVEAIHLQPMCESCHGDALGQDVIAALQHRYPKDRATGFSSGDFRGVFWVELPASAVAPANTP